MLQKDISKDERRWARDVNGLARKAAPCLGVEVELPFVADPNTSQ